ncbi:MAG TPA: DinB family protein [Vicinamibacterales bacterium]|jgi:uncharacterized damage-inducible protein DinB|nr:DinB family protein [Vicinamibacterales bacterium]
MNCYGGRHLAESFRTVRRNTLKIAEEIPEDKYTFKPTPHTRSVGQLLTHIALGTRFPQQIHQAQKVKTLEGFDFPGLMQRVGAEEQKPRSKAEIIQLLTHDGEAWAAWLEGLPDEFLAEEVAMPTGTQPAAKSRLEMLLSPKEHEMHHRGQLMLIQRMLGITPHLTRDFEARMAARAAQQQQPART